jgi:hypothetical protein
MELICRDKWKVQLNKHTTQAMNKSHGIESTSGTLDRFISVQF